MAFNWDKLSKAQRDYPKPKFALSYIDKLLKKNPGNPYLTVSHPICHVTPWLKCSRHGELMFLCNCNPSLKQLPSHCEMSASTSQHCRTKYCSNMLIGLSWKRHSGQIPNSITSALWAMKVSKHGRMPQASELPRKIAKTYGMLSSQRLCDKDAGMTFAQYVAVVYTFLEVQIMVLMHAGDRKV